MQRAFVYPRVLPDRMQRAFVYPRVLPDRMQRAFVYPRVLLHCTEVTERILRTRIRPLVENESESGSDDIF